MIQQPMSPEQEQALIMKERERKISLFLDYLKTVDE